MGCCWHGCARTASWTRSGSRAPGPTGPVWRCICGWPGSSWSDLDRPDRKARRRQGKSDPVDAEAAARAAQAGRATGIPKNRVGAVEALRALRVARRSAVAARAQAQTQMKSLIVTAPDPLRSQLRELGVRQLMAHCAARRPDRGAAAEPTTATLIALRALARRHQRLSAEIDDLDALITPLVTQINPALYALLGVGPDIAGQLLVTAGGNPHRLRSQAAFAMLCGAAPLPASSGRTQRHRLNRGGDRQANCALYQIVLCRLRWDPRTRAYAQHRTAEGMGKKEIIRCLKRYVAREVYTALLNPDPSSVFDRLAPLVGVNLVRPRCAAGAAGLTPQQAAGDLPVGS